MNNYCPNCGEPITGNFCSNCGKPVKLDVDPSIEHVSTTYIEPKYSTSAPLNANPHRHKNSGCLKLFMIFFSLFLIILIIGTVYTVQNEESQTNVTINSETKDSKTKLLEFDKQSWEDFKVLYTSHNNFMENISAYSENQINSVDFYDECVEAQNYFAKASLSFDYGTNDDERTYLNAFGSAATSDQQAAEYLMKYIDSGKTSHLSKAQENIQDAKDAFIMIAQNRGTLLIKAGLTDEEIHKKVESDMAELETETE
jgi:hypothetical protein